MNKNKNKNKIVYIIIGGVIVVLIIIGIIIGIKKNTSNNKTNRNITSIGYTSTDSTSNEEIFTSTNKSPEQSAKKQDDPYFVGIDKLVDRGLTIDQINIIKNNLIKQFSNIKSPKISLDTNNISHQINDSGNNNYTLIFVINDNSKYSCTFIADANNIDNFQINNL